jgi:MFS family permease
MSTAHNPHANAATPAADPYKGKWSTLSNTTLGVLMATIDASIVLISLPDIFRGIQLNPLTPGNTSYFLWLLMGYMLVTAVLVTSFGRLGDIFGRVKMYNLGFVIFTVFSILLSVTWMHGQAAALFMIIMRICQGVGGALLMANSTAILTDAFPPDRRGMALGTNMVAAIAGSFIGLMVGGILAPIDWRLVFWISVPVGIIGSIWGYINLKDKGIRTPAKIDWIGNVTFAAGLVALLIGIVYGIEPYGGHTMGWTSPFVDAMLAAGAVLLAFFVWIETRVEAPMFKIPLFRIRAFTAGNIASLMSSVGRGGMMFILIIWLQGIWLPQHGYSFTQTPLWAGIYMLPMTGGFLISGPLSGILSDKFGPRPFAVGGMVAAMVSFILLEILPINFSYPWFALLLLLNGLSMGIFAAPNRANIMNSLPAHQRGQGAGMATTGQNAAMVLSIGIFFTLIIIGLASSLHVDLLHGLVTHGVPAAAAQKVASLPPTSTVFGAFLGYNPIKSLLGPTGVLSHLSPANAAYLTGRSFFPQLISAPFAHGLHEAFDFAAAACAVAAIASLVIPSMKRGTAQRPALAGASAGQGQYPPAGGHHDLTGDRLVEAAARSGDPDVADGSEDINAEWARIMERSAQPAGQGAQPAGGGVSEFAGTVWRGIDVPLAGAAVTLIDGTGAQVARAVTQPAGRFHIAGVQPGSYTALITAPGHRPAATIITLNGVGATTDFTLTGTGALSGVVRHAPRAAHHGDADGARQNGQGDVASHHAPAAARQTADGVAPRTADGAATRTVDAVSARPADSGIARDTDGVSLAGVSVLLTDRAGEVVARTVTGPDGRYRFTDVPEGDYTLTVRTSEHKPATVAATVTGGAEARVDVGLAGNAALSGVVRQAASGEPLAGASVTLADASGYVVAETVTGPDGRYRFTDVPEGDYTVVASGFQPVAMPLRLDAGQQQDLDLTLGRSHG